MEFSDKDYDCVVSNIFNSLNHEVEKIPAQRVMKMIAPYIGSDRTEYLLLQEILDPFSNNENVDKSSLKDALLEWTLNLKKDKDARIMEGGSLITNYDTALAENSQYSSYCSISHEVAYQERISELQAEVAERERHSRALRRQLEHTILSAQQQEDALTQLVAEREQLKARIQAEQSNSAAFSLLKKENDDLTESLVTLRENSLVLKTSVEMLKKENNSLNNKIDELNNEKHSLTQSLLQSNADKDKALQQLSAAQADIETLKKDCFVYNTRINEQEKMIEYLTSVKYSLEVDLENTINISSHYKRQLDQSMEESNDDEAGALDINFSKEKHVLTKVDSDNNAVMVYTPPTRLSLRSKISNHLKKMLSNVLGSVFFWGMAICFTYSYLHLSNTMKYCDSVVRGVNVRFYPLRWMSLNEILLSIFEYKNTGPVPI